MSSEDRQEDSWSLRLAPWLCIGLLLFFTFRLYGYSYFWLDDFNNLSTIQPRSAIQMLSDLLNPASDFFRPLGMSLYWIGVQIVWYQCFPLPLPPLGKFTL